MKDRIDLPGEVDSRSEIGLALQMCKRFLGGVALSTAIVAAAVIPSAVDQFVLHDNQRNSPPPCEEASIDQQAVIPIDQGAVEVAQRVGHRVCNLG